MIAVQVYLVGKIKPQPRYRVLDSDQILSTNLTKKTAYLLADCLNKNKFFQEQYHHNSYASNLQPIQQDQVCSPTSHNNQPCSDDSSTSSSANDRTISSSAEVRGISELSLCETSQSVQNVGEQQNTSVAPGDSLTGSRKTGTGAFDRLAASILENSKRLTDKVRGYENTFKDLQTIGERMRDNDQRTTERIDAIHRWAEQNAGGSNESFTSNLDRSSTGITSSNGGDLPEAFIQVESEEIEDEDY